MTVKPPYYKVLWHKCNRCFTHYTSEAPHLRAYLCNDCWNAIPHYKVEAKKTADKAKGNAIKIKKFDKFKLLTKILYEYNLTKNLWK